MSVHVYRTHNAERMLTEVRVVRRYPDTDPQILTPFGGWAAVVSGDATHPSFVIPDDVLAEVLHALGNPADDSNLRDALNVERRRVDRILDRALGDER